MGLLFDFIYSLAALVLAPFWLRKRREGWRERFGHIEAPERGDKPRLLVHAVSVGEVNALRNLVPRLVGQYDLVISSTTDTGVARAMELFGGVAPIVRYPLDFSRCVRRFLDAVRPDMVVLTELELWPNFARACRKREIRLGIVNGRLSKRSFRRYLLIMPVLRRAFGRLDFVAAQDEQYARRFRVMGVREFCLQVTGSMKWDAVDVSADPEGANELRKKMGIDPERMLIVGGSTAPDEHRMLHRATPRGVQLLCAPRRPEWFDDAADELQSCIRWSKITRPILASTKNERFLLDTIGQLRHAYELADIAVVGRSFGRLFGSDPMEPAALGCAVMIGPAVDDFTEAVETLEAHDAIVRTSRHYFEHDLRELVADDERRARLGENARQCVLKMRGASERNADLIRLILPPPEVKKKPAKGKGKKKRKAGSHKKSRAKAGAKRKKR